MNTPPRGLAGRILFNVIYSALQAFIYAISAYLAARLLSSALLRVIARSAVRARTALWAATCCVAGIVWLPIARGVRRAIEIVQDARDQALLDSLGGAVR